MLKGMRINFIRRFLCKMFTNLVLDAIGYCYIYSYALVTSKFVLTIRYEKRPLTVCKLSGL